MPLTPPTGAASSARWRHQALAETSRISMVSAAWITHCPTPCRMRNQGSRLRTLAASATSSLSGPTSDTYAYSALQNSTAAARMASGTRSASASAILRMIRLMAPARALCPPTCSCIPAKTIWDANITRSRETSGTDSAWAASASGKILSLKDFSVICSMSTGPKRTVSLTRLSSGVPSGALTGMTAWPRPPQVGRISGPSALWYLGLK